MVEKKDRNLGADIVIIGGGGAGLPAALTAHDRGHEVVVLEKRGIVGGNALLAEGFFAADSPAQKRHPFQSHCSLLSQSGSPKFGIL